MSSWTTKVTNQEEQGTGPSFPLAKPVHKLTEYPRRWRQFLHEVRLEMKQVTWPTRDDVLSTTGVVIATVAFFGLFFLIVDSGVGYAVQQVFRLFQH